MESLLTGIAFTGLTGLFVAWHVGRRNAAAPAACVICPRCTRAVAHGAARCGACGVPLQIFELVRGPAIEDAAPEPDLRSGAAIRPHAIVRADQCVGCGLCVAVCPEPGALVMAGKLAVVDRAKCTGHARCAEACPVSAIILATGNAVHQVEVPLLSARFESSVAGVYIAGELGGRGLIKNAINEGKVAAEAIARELRSEPPRGAGAPPAHDLIIVGSGPAGLSAALEARGQGLDCIVLEQGSLAESIRKYPRHKLLLAEPVKIPLYGNLWIADSSKEDLLRLWEAVVTSAGLRIHTFCKVEKVERSGSLLEVTTSAGILRARRVILATGRRGTPRRLGVPGEDLDKVFYDIVEMEEFAGKRVLVVGGGDSAVESALGLANQSGTRVTLSYRSPQFNRLAPRNRQRIDKAVASGSVSLLLESTVAGITAESVQLQTKSGPLTIPNDTVIVRIGGEPPRAFLERVGVAIGRKALALPPSGDREAVAVG